MDDDDKADLARSGLAATELLEPGKIADLVVVRGDPARSISDVRQVTHVVQRGRVVASGGRLTDDGRPLPWSSAEIAERPALWRSLL